MATVSALSLSRIVLDAHYPTDVVCTVPLSLAMVEATEIMINSMMDRLDASANK